MPDIIGVGEVLWDLLPGGARLGGAPCNFAFHCRQLGHDAAIVSCVGIDEPGDRLRSELTGLGLPQDHLQIDSLKPTGTVKVDLDAAGHPTYTIVEDVAYDYLAWNDDLAKFAHTAQAICFGTLAQRNLVSQRTIQRFLDLAYQSRLGPIVVCDINLRQQFYNRDVIEQSLLRSHWLKLNTDELDVLTNLFDLPRVSASDALAELRRRFRLDLVCLTRGADGFLVQARDEIGMPGIPTRVVDTVGAGDAFTAGLVCLTLEGRPLDAAAAFANRLAARVAAEIGGTPQIDRQEIEV
jgi:fructokinase